MKHKKNYAKPKSPKAQATAKKINSKKPFSNGLHHKVTRAIVKKSPSTLTRALTSPVLVIVLVFVAILLIAWTYKVMADPTISAKPLTVGAQITYPSNHSILTQNNIMIQGTCASSSYVKLYDNGLFKGVDFCSAENTFQIKATLYLSLNQLVANDYNYSNQLGPKTRDLSVNYDPTDSTANGLVNNNPRGIKPLLIISDYSYQDPTINSNYSQEITLAGGAAPYKINVNWGDGEQDETLSTFSTSLSLKHTYHKEGRYIIIVDSTDESHQYNSIQLAAMITK